MKSKFKWTDFLLDIGTILAFILSIVLWIFVMTNDESFSRVDQTSSVSQQIRNRRNKSVSDLYMPTSSYGFSHGQLCRLYDSKKNLPLEFTKEVKNARFGTVRKVSTSQERYERLLNDPQLVQLAYPDEITLNLFIGRDGRTNNRKFRRIFVSPDDHVLYAADDASYTVYRIGVRNADFKTLRQYADRARNKIAIKFIRLKSGYSEFYSRPSKWRVYSYLTSAQSASYFVSHLLGTANVASRTKKGKTTYTLNYDMRLQAPAANNTRQHSFQYVHYKKMHNLSPATLLLDSVDYVHKIGLSEQDLRFFDVDNSAVRYTNYIEGLPVFQNQNDVQVGTAFTPNSVTLDFNNLDLQIPIPFDGQTRTLPATASAIASLEKLGLRREEVERIMVGFEVTTDNSHDNLVNLIPTYYLKIGGQWKSLAQWQQQDFAANDKSKQMDQGGN